MAKFLHFSPEVVDNLTLAQAYMYLDCIHETSQEIALQNKHAQAQAYLRGQAYA